MDTTQYTTTPVSVLLIPYSPTSAPVLLVFYSLLLPKHQSYWYPTVHYCPSPRPIDTHIPLLPQYEFYWYHAVHNCPISSPIDMTTVPGLVILYMIKYCSSTSFTDATQSAIVPVPAVLIQHNPYLFQYKYKFYWYPIVLYCRSTSPTDMT